MQVSTLSSSRIFRGELSLLSVNIGSNIDRVIQLAQEDIFGIRHIITLNTINCNNDINTNMMKNDFRD